MKQPIRRFALSIIALGALTACSGADDDTTIQPTTQLQYDQAVSAAVAKTTRAPPSIVGTGLTGVTHVQIVLAPDGTLISADVSQSSGTSGLDDFALEGVENAKFPVLPATVPQQAQQFDFPINFGMARPSGS